MSVVPVKEMLSWSPFAAVTTPPPAITSTQKMFGSGTVRERRRR